MADLVKARESYWAGDAMVPVGAVMAANDPRVRGAFVDPFDPVPATEPAAPEPAAPARASRASKST